MTPAQWSVLYDKATSSHGPETGSAADLLALGRAASG